MKKILLSLSLVTLSLLGKAQTPCSNLIISEYVEGTNNNKAIELYNASSAPISFVDYRIIRWDNGNVNFTPVEGEMQLPINITLAPYQTYVIALNLTDPNGTGQTLPIAVALQAKADTLLCPGCATGTGNSRVMCFNGNDALSLEKKVNNVWTKVDIFGKIGEDPGTAWSTVSPFNGAGTWITKDYTLQRKATVNGGVTVNPTVFEALVEYDSLSKDTWTGLGAHVCDCSINGINENSKSFAFSVYPNPSSASIKLESNSILSKIFIYNVVGQEMKSIVSKNNLSGSLINTSDLAKGIYTIIVFDEKSNKSINKLIIE